jgi:hypothetical protein
MADDASPKPRETKKAAVKAKPEQPDDTGSKQAAIAANQFKPGQSGNPAGRPKGARSKLAEAFVADLYENWLENGVATLEKVRVEKPDQYVKVVASILPQQLNVTVSDLDDLSDEQLDRRIDALARALKLEIGTGQSAGGQGQAKAGKSLN